jgi:two-component system, NtrC family, response regulator AtoC
MTSSCPTILVADDDKDVRDYLEMALSCAHCAVELARDGQEAIDLASGRSEPLAGAIIDLLMPRCDGFSALREIKRIDPSIPAFALSAANVPGNVVEAMKAGAADFLEKPVTSEDLSKVLRALRVAPGSWSPDAEIADQPPDTFYLGASPAMRHVAALLRQIGRSSPPVLIQGETGSGKEVLARQLHRLSPRADQAFLKLNCTAIPGGLVESELFGYERGAFTGAFQRKTGMFEQANGGTILLDEIGDMDIKLQAKLLQVLQDREFQRLGGNETIRVDVRIMAATHRDLERAMHEGAFRHDLYYRLNVVNITIPPLRERPEDIVGLARCLLKAHSGTATPSIAIVPRVERALLEYHWPGNIRELENVMRRYLVFRDPDAIVAELSARSTRRQPIVMASAAVMAVGGGVAVQAGARPIPIRGTDVASLSAVAKAKDQAQSEAILVALEATHWNRKRAAQLLNIDYKALLYRMKKLSIGEKPSYSGGA